MLIRSFNTSIQVAVAQKILDTHLSHTGLINVRIHPEESMKIYVINPGMT